MRHEEQETAKAFLSDPDSYGMTNTIERIDTHISQLFLVGKRVFKLKRAVCLPYLDFSTPARRLAACEAEVRLNRRTAPELCLGVRRITAGPNGPEFDGSGPLLDAVVEMRRFDQDALFDSMAQRGALTSRYLDALAQEITALHASARVDGDADGVDNIRSVLRVNAEAFQQSTIFSKDDIARLVAGFNHALETHAARLDARSERLLEDGVTVIVDAVHDRAEDRARIAAVAAATGAPFDGVWLQADPAALHLRLKTRDPGASDADADVLANQLARAPKATNWQTVSTGQTVTDSLNGILATVTEGRDRPSLTQ